MPSELKNSMKGLINIKNNDNKCFLWCHARHLSLIDKNPQRITKENEEIISNLDYERINFCVSKKDYCRIKMQNKICVNVFYYGNKSTCLAYLSNQKFNDNMDLLLISSKFKSMMCISKILTDLCSIKQKIRVKNTFIKIAYRFLVVKRF